MSNFKNVEAFNRLIGICTGYGGAYNPGSPNLHIESLSELLTQARTVLLQVSVAKTGFENATNQREVVFNQASQIASRILSELKSASALPQTIADAALMVRKIRGRARTAMVEVKQEGAEAITMLKRFRITGTGYESAVYHFEKLITTLEAETRFNPGIAALQIPALKQLLVNMRTSNQAVIDAYSNLSQLRIQRNQLLYRSEGSMYKTARAVKEQIRALFGARSETAGAANRISLRTN
jgi:hypothetical protein